MPRKKVQCAECHKLCFAAKGGSCRNCAPMRSRSSRPVPIVTACVECGEKITNKTRWMRKYCSEPCRTKGRKKLTGPAAPAWKGEGHSYRKWKRGRLHLYVRDVDGKWRSEHRMIAEKAMGRPLKRSEVVHHINCNSLDNRNENLLICTVPYHTWLHGEYSRQFGKTLGVH